jgi:hypothetical protein
MMAFELPMRSWIGFSAVTGRPKNAKDLRAFVGGFDWRETFVRLAHLTASPRSDSYSTKANDRLRFALSQCWYSWQSEPTPERHLVADHFRFFAHDALVLHEEVVYFLQAAALMEGSENGRAPMVTDLGMMVLGANDFLGGWKELGEYDEDAVEPLVAELCRVTRFNRSADPLREIIRAYMLFQERPRGVASDAEWEKVQAAAFGSTYALFFESCVDPLAAMTHLWEINEWPPVLDEGKWLTVPFESPQAHEFVARLTWDVDSAREEIGKNLDATGLPHSPSLFFKKPFVRIGPGRVVAASPHMVREQLFLGAWNTFREKLKHWHYRFGDLVEEWCRRVARWAETSADFKGKLILSDAIGSVDEIEDIVLLEPGRVILFSVKSRLLRHSDVKDAASRPAIVAWHEELLFAPKLPGKSAGAFRLLHDRATAIRGGVHAPAIPSDARIIPVLVTFEELGDNGALRAWTDQRLENEALLQQADVGGAVFATVAEFEELMALAARGHLAGDVLETYLVERRSRLKDVLHDKEPDTLLRRLPQMEREFEKMTESVRRTLQGARDRVPESNGSTR